MKKYLGYIKSDLNRIFCSKLLYASVLFYLLAIWLILFFEGIGNHMSIWTSYGALLEIQGFSNMNRALFLIASLPMATSYCDDISNKYQNLLVIRGDIKAYIFSKILVCFFSAFIISFMSLNMCALFLAITNDAGVINTGNYNTSNVYYDYMSGPFPYMTIIAMTFLFSLVSGVYAVLGLAFSAFVKGRFAAFAAATFISIVMEVLYKFIPKSLSLFAIQYGNNAYRTGTTITILLSILVALGYILIGSIIFGRRVRRRLSNEID